MATARPVVKGTETWVVTTIDVPPKGMHAYPVWPGDEGRERPGINL